MKNLKSNQNGSLNSYENEKSDKKVGGVLYNSII